MKIENKDGKPFFIPETPAETAAIKWQADHPPVFSTSAEYGLQAYLAGYKAGGGGFPKLKELARELESTIDQLSTNASDLESTIDELRDNIK